MGPDREGMGPYDLGGMPTGTPAPDSHSLHGPALPSPEARAGDWAERLQKVEGLQMSQIRGVRLKSRL